MSQHPVRMREATRMILSLLPTSLRRALAVRVQRQVAARAARRAPQRPAAEIFAEVYAQGVWGSGDTPFYSGGGSDPRFAGPYCAAVRDYVDALPIDRPVIVDLGCGDFRVGAELLADWDVSYVGVDVVPALIDHHQRTHTDERTRFICADLVESELPPGDVCLIRQVFQHLSNEQIRLVLKKLEQYPHVIVTEHYPADETTAIANLDKAPGADTRLARNSAVYLEAPPFSQRIVPVLALPGDPGQIRTFALAGAV